MYAISGTYTQTNILYHNYGVSHGTVTMSYLTILFNIIYFTVSIILVIILYLYYIVYRYNNITFYVLRTIRLNEFVTSKLLQNANAKYNIRYNIETRVIVMRVQI